MLWSNALDAFLYYAQIIPWLNNALYTNISFPYCLWASPVFLDPLQQMTCRPRA